MKKHVAALAVFALSAGVCLPALTLTPAQALPLAAAASADSSDSFEYAQEHSTPQKFNLDLGGPVTIYAATLSVDTRSNARQVLLYGEFGLPLNATDFDVEEFDGHFYLGQDDNFFKYNEYIRGYLMWDENDPKAKYDKTRFRVPDKIWVKGDSITLTLEGQELTVKIAQNSSILNTSELEEAVNEHWTDYQAATNSGLKIDEATEKAYLAKNDEARALLAEAAKPDTTVTNEQLSAMRTSLNEVFGDLKPVPFMRETLTNLLAQADQIVANNGMNGERLTKATFDALNAAAARAAELVNTEDLKGILPPREGDPLPTHRDFTAAENALKAAIEGIQKEQYTAPDTSALSALRDQAIARVPAEGYGFTADTRTALLDQIEEASNLLANKTYTTEADVTAAQTALQQALNALAEEKLDTSKPVTIKVRYVHPAKDAVSSLLREYFEENGTMIEESLTVLNGEEVRIPITSDLVKKFEGYHPSTFHFASDDSSLRLVRILTDSMGNQVAAFKAQVANPEAGASLDIFYLEGDDTRTEESNTQGEGDGQSTGEGNGQAEGDGMPAVDQKTTPKAQSKKLAHTGSDAAQLAFAGSLLAGAGALSLRRNRQRD